MSRAELCVCGETRRRVPAELAASWYAKLREFLGVERSCDTRCDGVTHAFWRLTASHFERSRLRWSPSSLLRPTYQEFCEAYGLNPVITEEPTADTITTTEDR
jgi:hypothetical protein